MDRCAVLVDAGYLFKAGGALLGRQNCKREELVLDGPAVMAALADAALQITGQTLLRVYWYDGSKPGSTDHRAIAELYHLKLRLGYINSEGEQKGVDPLIITDMMTLARNRACTEMVLLSGDGDLIVGVRHAQEYGVRVHLLGLAPARANQGQPLREEVDACYEWDAMAISKVMRLATQEERNERLWPRRASRGAPTAPTAPTAPATPSRLSFATALGDDPASPPSRQASALESISRVQDGVQVNVQIGVQGAGQGGGYDGAQDGVYLATDARRAPHLMPVPRLAAPFTDAQLRDVAETVARELLPAERTQIATCTPFGFVPGAVDRRLLGTAKAMLQGILQEAEKRTVRRHLAEVCREQEALMPESSALPSAENAASTEAPEALAASRDHVEATAEPASDDAATA